MIIMYNRRHDVKLYFLENIIRHNFKLYKILKYNK